ncbi:MAG: M23 family metallopeptidase [Candidatus Hydrogenedentota bacterium]|nr:MAG: M23 family metallopeptidase [Candidatus Hydrogenedentota bacterium]
MTPFLIFVVSCGAAYSSLVPHGGTPRPPLDLKRYALASSFGEYRSRHLHAGLDIATSGKTGFPVHAWRSGRVVRIRSSSNGYGNAIYLQHSDGSQTVYAHLEGFPKRFQHLLPRPPHPLGGDKNGNPMQVYPKNPPHVRKGEVIGYTGESGAGLPHLHFELRNALEHPLNPVSAGFPVEDSVPPRLLAIGFEPATASARVANDIGTVFTNTSGIRLEAAGPIRILLRAYDEDGAGGGRLGLTSIDLFVDSHPWSSIRMEEFSYERIGEVGLVYDHFRSGFSPTIYTYDLTAPNDAAMVVTSRGPVPAGRKPLKIEVRARDLAGNQSRFFSTLLPVQHRSTPPTSQPNLLWDTISLTPAGILVRNDDRFLRISKTSRGESGTFRWKILSEKRSRSDPTLLEPDSFFPLTLVGEFRALRLLLFQDSSFPLPPYAVAPPFFLGPYGRTARRSGKICVKRIGRENGLALLKNGEWKWISGSRSDSFGTSAPLPFLAPVVPVRDETPPAVRWFSKRKRRIVIRDDFSGIDPESISVRENKQSGRVLDGRYDSDHHWFIIGDRTIPPGGIMVTVRDRAGNETRALLGGKAR